LYKGSQNPPNVATALLAETVGSLQHLHSIFQKAKFKNLRLFTVSCFPNNDHQTAKLVLWMCVYEMCLFVMCSNMISELYVENIFFSILCHDDNADYRASNDLLLQLMPQYLEQLIVAQLFRK
jgi:hypothetical protein